MGEFLKSIELINLLLVGVIFAIVSLITETKDINKRLKVISNSLLSYSLYQKDKVKYADENNDEIEDGFLMEMLYELKDIKRFLKDNSQKTHELTDLEEEFEEKEFQEFKNKNADSEQDSP